MKAADLVRKKRNKYVKTYYPGDGCEGKPEIGVVVQMLTSKIQSPNLQETGIVRVNWPGWGTFTTPSHTLEVVSEGR